MTAISLYFKAGKSDKEYHIQIVNCEGGAKVNFQFGRRGGTLQDGTKTPSAVGHLQAQDIFDSLVEEKKAKGYEEQGEAKAGQVAPPPERTEYRTEYPVELLEETDAATAECLIKDKRYWLQVKLDGHRRQIEKTAASGYISYNKLGKAVALPSEVVLALAAIPLKTFHLDGELIGDVYIAYDLLAANGESIAAEPYRSRFTSLITAMRSIPNDHLSTVVTWKTTAEKTGGLATLKETRCEGGVFKLIDAAYRAGDRGQHKKYKFTKTISGKVTAVGTDGKSNATVALLDGKTWLDVCEVSTIGKGKIEVGQVVEIIFLYATEGKRLYQPRIKEVRKDVKPSECTMAQLKHAYKAGVAA
jgi:bifunctional non-homologous end joining protein LigD